MSAAIAVAPSPAPYDKPGCSDLPPTSGPAAPSPSSRNKLAQAANTSSQAASSSGTASVSAPSHRSGSRSPKGRSGPVSSPPGVHSNRNGVPPKIVVKKEPRSPELPAPRHRPRRLDLSKGSHTSSNQPGSARPMTAREGLAIQEVGIACLSPGFVTHDPIMQEQVQRSMSVRDQQRHLIEQRLQQQSAKGDGPDTGGREAVSQFAAKTPGMSRRNKAPPGLSIIAPSAQQFAHERVIQSAPLGQTFTGRHNPQPLTRHVTNHPATLSNTSHIHHVPANQTKNRLPPISDVFGQDLSGHPDNAPASMYPPATSRGPLVSPSHPPPSMQHQVPTPNRPREYKSAEEAQVELAGGRPELLPKIVRYGGPPQPPTPPSPLPGIRATEHGQPSSKRRTRAEYEEGVSPPLGTGPAPTRRGPFGAGRDSPETQRQKREEFLQLCGRAWDLFHS
ncbi:hypothetical protein ACRALDRAFT_2043771 [Sodiomyces alcalophilus JCM 7366]|uniref:uncharacterized protein n=1 Tax=Sodiomyces alcalophilus JCM 7366 TaxID=591952 RepID=UPI0039B6AE5C